jgi:hypothetical protein
MMASMGNDKFQDVDVLNILAELQQNDLLNKEDRAALVASLKSAWGREQVPSVLNEATEAVA